MCEANPSTSVVPKLPSLLCQNPSKIQLTMLKNILFVINFSIANNLSYVAMHDMLKKFGTKYPGLESIRKIRLWLSSQSAPTLHFYICPQSTCNGFFQEGNVPKQCPKCGIDVEEKRLRKDGRYFLYTPISGLLKAYLESERNEKDILEFITRMNQGSPILSDITDSERYKALREVYGRMRQAPGNSFRGYDMMSFMINIDGVQAAKSATNSLYPLQVSLVELSPSLRRQSILTPFLIMKNKSKGIDFKESYLQPFIDECNELATKGLEWYSQLYQKIFCTQFIVYCLNCDSVMKPVLLCIKGHSGYHSCPLCTIKGSVSGRGKVVKPDRLDATGTLEKFPLRPQRNEDIAVLVASEEKLGHKAVPLLAALPFFNVFFCTSIDAMHAIDLGVFKKIFKILFVLPGHKHVSRGGFALADGVMKGLKGVSFIDRGPRSMTDYKNWKASEWHYWGFIYSIPVFYQLVEEKMMEVKHFINWIDLITALSMLNSCHITQQQIALADTMLTRIVTKFVELYGKEHASLNIHLLVHLADSVKHLGPLWSTTLYAYESYNQVFLNSYRQGSKGIEKQITERLQWRHRAIELYDFIALNSSPDDDLSGTLTAKIWRISLPTTEISGLGKPSIVEGFCPAVSQPTVKEYLLALGVTDTSKLYFFDRVRSKGVIYWTKEYCTRKKGKKDESSFYSERADVYGSIRHLIKFHDKFIVVFNKLCPLENTETQVFINGLPHMKICYNDHIFYAMSLNEVTSKCFAFAKLNDRSVVFIAKQQNKNECK